MKMVNIVLEVLFVDFLLVLLVEVAYLMGHIVRLVNPKGQILQ